MSEQKQKLLEYLERVARSREENAPYLDREAAHDYAESLLLTLLGDPEVTAAWNQASCNWWYS